MFDTNFLFSIIIPTYNRENQISATIESVLNQTFDKFEILVIDNHSTDLTKDKVLSFKDKRIKFHQNEKNLERCYSRNKGVELAKGEYILFLDSDDYFEKNHLQNWFDCIINNQSRDFFICKKKNSINNSLLNENVPFDNKNNTIHFFIKNPIVPGQVCIKKKLLELKKFNARYLIFEDTALWIQISTISKPMFVDFDSFIYCIHDDNSVNWKNKNFGLIRLNSIKNFFKDNKYVLKKIKSSDYYKLISSTYFTVSKHYIYKNQNLKSLYYLLISIFFYPSSYQLKHRFLILIKLVFLINIKEYKVK
jgi:teichuronic acid biosynthesis glycosyltransferase TuaG